MKNINTLKLGSIVLAFLLTLASCNQNKKATSNVDWAYYGNDLGNTRFSELNQINDQNVSKLQLAWSQDLDPKEAYEGTPIVVDGVMYVTTPLGPKNVYAFDAASGEQIWKTDLGVPQDYQQYACCGLVNRGATYSNGKIFVGRLDGKISALDTKTGAEIWTSTHIDYKSGAVITSPPLPVEKHNIIVTGHGGGEYGTSSRITAYDMDSGKEVWKCFTVPQDDPEVVDSWKGESYKLAGAAPWLVGSYCPDTDIIYWGTSNPSPWNATLRGDDPKEDGSIKHRNLHSSSTLAINPADGSIKWNFQQTPFDAWDYDGTNEKVFATLDIEGKKRDVIMQADRNGFFFVNDRNTGKLISAKNYVRANWATGYDIEKEMPIENPKYRTTTKKSTLNEEERVWPSFIGGKNWEAMGYSKETGLVYIPANNLGMTFEISEASYNKGSFYLGAGWEIIGEEGNPGELIAWDPIKGEKAWSVSTKFPMPGGVVSTSGNLVFFGDLTGKFYAHNAKTGKRLWEYQTESGIIAAPMTYKVNGTQYIAVLEGRPNVIIGFIGGKLGEDVLRETPQGGKLNVFALEQE